MGVKTRIKQAITDNTGYRAVKVWNIHSDTNLAGQTTMWIEVEVQKKSKPKSRNNGKKYTGTGRASRSDR